MSEMKMAPSQPQPNYEATPADDEVAFYAYDKFTPPCIYQDGYLCQQSLWTVQMSMLFSS